MKVMYAVDSAEGMILTEGEAPQPQPGPGKVLIRVVAAGVTTTELQWYPTRHTKEGDLRFQAIPGHEFSGVIAGASLEGTGKFSLGQEVFGMNDWFTDGAMAEFCVAPISALTPKPPTLTHVQAASVPIGALTAWQGLFDRAKLQSGERVLVQGGAGAVGLYAVQLAKWKGAYVIATASALNVDFVALLGADEVIDYRASRFEGAGQVDVVFDTVGGDTLARSWGVLKPQGRMVTVVSTAENATDQRIKDAFFIVDPNGEQLARIARLLDAQHLTAVVDAVFPLAHASDVYRERVVRHGRGKLVVAVTGEGASEQ